jgi:sugar diacid utilization regulator
VLGSIWAAVREKPSQERIDDFARAASFVAIHLLRHRLASDVQRGLQTELVSAVLGGGPLAADAARRLGLAGDSFRVLAVGMRRGDAIDNELSLARCWDALSLHLSAVHRRATSAVIGGVVYAVLPAAADAESSRRIAREAAEGFLARLQPALRDGALIAAGGHAPRLEGIPASRQDADRVLRVLRDSNRDDRAFADIEQMHVHVLLDRLGEVAADDPASPSGPLRTLLERDARQGTRLAETLRAYLDAFGDVNLAAERLGIHHNTLRYRLERVREIPGLDLTDPELRLALQLQLRWLPRAEEEARTTAAGRRPRRR